MGKEVLVSIYKVGITDHDVCGQFLFRI